MSERTRQSSKRNPVPETREEPAAATRDVVAAVTILILLAAFLYSTSSILSPFVSGGLLIFILAAGRGQDLRRRLLSGTIFILALWIFLQARLVFFPFIISLVLAFLLNPVVDWLEGKGLPRLPVVLIVLLVLLALAVAGGIILLPGLIHEIQTLIEKIPDLAAELVRQVKVNLKAVLDFLRVDSTRLQQELAGEIPARAEAVLSNLLRSISGVGALFGKLIYLILIPILTFYFLKDYHRVADWFLELIPRKKRSLVTFYQWRLNRILGGYIRGQVIVSSLVGLLTGVGLTLFHIPFAIIIGLMAGVLNFIPFVGLYVSLGLALLTAFFTPAPLVALLKIGFVFLVVQGLESYIISPKIVGDRVGLHPIAVILSVLIFAYFLGFWGLLVGVPTAALLKFLLDEWRRHLKWRELRAAE